MLRFINNYLTQPSEDVLIEAAKNGDVEMVERCLAAPEISPVSAFTWAVANGHTEVVKLFLADSRVIPGGKENYPLFHAVQNGHTEVVRLLLSDHRVDPTESSAIAIAANCGHIEVVKVLLADPRVSPIRSNYNALSSAVAASDPEMVKLLLADGRAEPTSNIILSAIIRGCIEWDQDELLLGEHRFNPVRVIKLLLAKHRVDLVSVINQAAREAANVAYRVDDSNTYRANRLNAVISLLEYPAAVAYVCENLQDFITKNPAIQNALTNSHAEYNEAFRTKFFSLVSKEFMSTIPNYLAALHANGMPNDVIVHNIAPHLNFYFECCKEKIMNTNEKVKITSDDITLINQSYALLPSQTTKSDVQDSNEKLLNQTKKLRLESNAIVKDNKAANTDIMPKRYRNV